MNRLILLLAAFIAFNANALSEEIPDDTKNNYKTLEQLNIEAILFESNDYGNDYFDLNSLEVIEIEEEININFDIKKYLPENFNALAGMYDLNWDTIELVEIEEEVELEFDTKKYLPNNFNALAGMHDLNWNAIELIELEEEVELGFDVEEYLPIGFNPYKSISCEREVVVCLY